MDIKKYYEVVTESWQFFRKWATTDKDMEEWMTLISEANDIVAAHRADGMESFSASILATMVTEMEKVVPGGDGQ